MKKLLAAAVTLIATLGFAVQGFALELEQCTECVPPLMLWVFEFFVRFVLFGWIWM